MRLIEFLLADGKNELLPAITANQGFVHKIQSCTSFTAKTIPPLDYKVKLIYSR
jgi:hypothetical protein